jgi:hypothetical protein
MDCELKTTDFRVTVVQSIKRPGYRLDDQGLIPGRNSDFSLCHHVQAGSGAHPAY